jgi:hypothetical protein
MTSQEEHASESDLEQRHRPSEVASRPATATSWAIRHRVLVTVLVLLALLVYNTAASFFNGFLLPSTTTVVLIAIALWVLLWWPSFAIKSSPPAPISQEQVASEQKEIEAELDKIDKYGVAKVIRLSRLELARFYNLTIGQTQGSYRWALLASWLGLLVIAAGVLELFGIITPLSHSKSGSSSLGTPAGSIVTISAGAVVEVVSVLFLGVYRNVNRRFSYFYDRQMHLYGILMASRISAGMKDSDSANKIIIEQITARTWNPEEEQQPKIQGRPWRPSQNGQVPALPEANSSNSNRSRPRTRSDDAR